MRFPHIFNACRAKAILRTIYYDSLICDGEADAKVGRWALGVGRSGVKS